MGDNFKALISEINKRYGLSSIMRADDSTALEVVRRVPTGIPAYDIALGGGFPLSRMMMLRGPESGGKSLLALKHVASFQRHCRHCGKALVGWDELRQRVCDPSQEDGCSCKSPSPMRCVWFDAEHSFAAPWARRMGVDTSDLWVIRTEDAEQGIDVADAAIRSQECDLLVVDSIAALEPRKEIDTAARDTTKLVGLLPRLITSAMRRWTSAQNQDSLTRRFSASVLCINQLRYKIGLVYGNPETSPGGKALAHHMSITARVKKTGVKEEIKGLPAAHEMEVAITKNKTAPPMRTASFNVAIVPMQGRAAGSTNYADQVLSCALFWGIVKKSGAWIHLAKGVKEQGIDAAAAWLMQPEAAAVLAMLSKEVLKREVGWLSGKLEED